MDYYQKSNNRFFAACCSLIAHILLTPQHIVSSQVTDKSCIARPSHERLDLDIQRLLEAFSGKEYDDAAIMMQQTPEIFKLLSLDVQACICDSIELPEAEQTDQTITSKITIATMLLQHNPELCKNFQEPTLRQLCKHVNDDPSKHSNLFKGLIEGFFKLREIKFYPEIISLVAQNKTINDTTAYSLPAELKEFLLQHQYKERRDHNAYEVVFKHSLTKLFQHPALTYDDYTTTCHINSAHVSSPQLPSLLHHIIEYAYPGDCLLMLKFALQEGASIRAVDDSQDSAEEHAKSYNPSCVLFLQEYEAYMPTYNKGNIDKKDYDTLLCAYNDFMLEDTLQPLYELLRPNVAENCLDEETLCNRNCFANKVSEDYLLSQASYIAVCNSRYLHRELLPILQNLRKMQSSSNKAKDLDTIFLEAIIDNKIATVSDMCNRGYRVNTFYTSSDIPDHYESLPLWASVAAGRPEITQILLNHNASLVLHPSWCPERSIAHFALHSCFHQYMHSTITPGCHTTYPQHLATLRRVLNHTKQNINKPEISGKALLEYAIRFKAKEADLAPNSMEIINILLELGADPFQKSSDSLSLEELARNLNNPILEKWLIDYKAAHPKK